MLSTAFSKTLNLEWNVSPQVEQVSQYMIMVSDTTPIDLGNGAYNYDTSKLSTSTSTQITVSDTVVNYITIMAYNVKGWGPVAMEIKNTPNRVMAVEETLAINPITGQNSLKVSIRDDAGRYVLMQASDDLQVWEEYGKFIVGFYDIYVEYVPIDRPRRFFRYSYVQSQIVAPNILIEQPVEDIIVPVIEQPIAAQPIETFMAPKKPTQIIPVRKDKKQSIKYKKTANKFVNKKKPTGRYTSLWQRIKDSL